MTPSDIDTKCAPLSRDLGDKLLYPCGLISQSVFTDQFFNATIVATGMNATQVSWTGQGIAWKSDLGKYLPFKEYNNATMSNIDFFTGSQSSSSPQVTLVSPFSPRLSPLSLSPLLLSSSRFLLFTTNLHNVGLPIDHTTEDFMVWMRTSSLPTFMKLRYIINTPLTAGTFLSVTVHNTFDVSFEGGSLSRKREGKRKNER